MDNHEADALAGLSCPSPALSFEFTTIQPCVTATCLERCAELGYTHYNAVLGENLTFVHDAWMGAEAIGAWVRALPQNANSGDIYARLPARL